MKLLRQQDWDTQNRLRAGPGTKLPLGTLSTHQFHIIDVFCNKSQQYRFFFTMHCIGIILMDDDLKISHENKSSTN